MNGGGERQTCLRSCGQGTNFVTDGHMSRRKQVVLKLLLLHGLELALEFVFIDTLHACWLRDGLADFFDYGVLLAEFFPDGCEQNGHG
jgi:hypothetical protein